MKSTSRSCLHAAVPPLPKLLLVLLLLSSIEMVVGLRARKLLLSPPLKNKSALCSEQEVPLLKIRIVTRKLLSLSQSKKISSSEQGKSSLKIDTGSGSTSSSNNRSVIMPAKQGMVSKRRIPPSRSNPTQNKSRNP
ncbi:uncharacterized protein LOC121992602 [Zingiber officinale]|uniref:uncharacterized protein LOC121992602 n=1 Tax=Zingiber officinale TaxID=94328 RepID=UPI001C4D7F54|nr:uncharacterized protein LOC121992602 [Zingiber officinale]